MKLWTPNQKLDNGRLIIDKIIGSGGFGITYSAKEKSKDKLVVIKTLNQIQQTKEEFRPASRLEARKPLVTLG
ncbi:MAG TPA: hypothetical protein VK203_18575 [Nostocaceae cyanobacterium]|nr:hypothetical protein [Nostocaceae cyanobacterium]